MSDASEREELSGFDLMECSKALAALLILQTFLILLNEILWVSKIFEGLSACE